MNIKKKKQLNLPQLIDWAWDNDIKNKEFRAKGSYSEVIFGDEGDFSLGQMGFVEEKDTFTVEVEEEITEDTEFKSMVEVSTDDLFAIWENSNIRTWKNGHSKEFHAYIDGEFKCIWRNGKLVV